MLKNSKQFLPVIFLLLAGLLVLVNFKNYSKAAGPSSFGDQVGAGGAINCTPGVNCSNFCGTTQSYSKSYSDAPNNRLMDIVANLVDWDDSSFVSATDFGGQYFYSGGSACDYTNSLPHGSGTYGKCDSDCGAGSTPWFQTLYFYTWHNAPRSANVNITDLNMQGGTMGGTLYYTVSRYVCDPGQVINEDALHNFSCTNVSGTITVSPSSCAAPCDPSINWTSNAYSHTQVFIRDTSNPNNQHVQLDGNQPANGGSSYSGLSGSSGLSAGNYEFCLSGDDAFGTNITFIAPCVPISVATYSFTVTPSLSFLSAQGGPPQSDTVTLQNTGTEVLTISGTDNASWLSLSPSSNTIQAQGNSGDSLPVTITVNPAGLASGTYNGTVTFTDAGGNAGSKTVSVTLTITPPLLPLVCAPGTQTTQPGTSVTVSASGGTIPYTWSAPLGGTVNPTTGTSTQFQASTPGTYKARVTDSGTQQVECDVNVTAPAQSAISVTPSTMTFSGVMGGPTPASQSFTVSNTGSATMDWSAATAASCTFLPTFPNGWNGTLNPSTADNSKTISVPSPNAVGAPGTYTCTITFTGTNSAGGQATGSPQTITVTYTVTQSAISVTPSTMTFSGVMGGPTPASQSFTVSNTGSATMLWSAGADFSWCSVSPWTSGAGGLAPGGSTPGTISVPSPSAMGAPQTYTCTITFIGSNVTGGGAATGSPQKIVVTYIVSPLGSYTLTVTKAGAGSGTVTSSPAGINCGATCSANYTTGTSVTLTATPSAGSTFAGWSGGGCSAGTGTCTVIINANTAVTATFNISLPGSFTLNSLGTGSPPSATSCSGTTPQITLTWTSSSGATSYSVYRSVAPAPPTPPAYASNVTSPYTDTSVTSGTTYNYFIRAFNTGGSTDSNTESFTAVWCLGDITVNATYNSSTWTGSVNYRLLGPGPTVNGNSVASTHTDLLLGAWTLDYQSGGPAGATLQSIAPVPTQTLPSNQVGGKPLRIFTLNFTSTPDFSLTASPGSRTIYQGQNTTYTVSASCLNGFTGPVTNLQLTNLHPGATSSYGPTSISCGGSSTLTITTTGSTQTGTRTLTISGDGAGVGTRTTTASLTVNSLNPPTSQPTSNATCQQITVNWNDNSNNEDGFHIWRNTSGGSNLATYTQIATRPANSTSHTDTPPTPNQTYYYIVTAYVGSVESTVDASFPVGPVNNNPCAANLAGSQKIIYRVNGDPYTGQTINNGDTISFRVIIDNSAGTVPAYDVYIVDTLTDNLQYVAGSATISGTSLNGENISGQTITWPQRPPNSNNLGDKAADSNNWVLTFDATVNSPSLQPIDFFQNSATIYYATTNGGQQNSTLTVKSPLAPIKLGQTKVPTIKEVAP